MTVSNAPKGGSVVSHAAKAPATVYEKAAWIMLAAGILLVLRFGLLPALLAGLLVHSLVHALARRLAGKALSHHRAKLVAVSVIAIVIIGAATVLVLLLVAFLKGTFGALPALMDRMAAILETARDRLGWGAWIPAADDVKNAMARTIREHARELERAGGEVGRVFLHALAGSVIGALTAFEMRRPNAPLSSALGDRIGRLADAFDRVVFAQVRISGLNTILTGLYLLLVLPLCGVELPLRKTLIVITFIVGMIPVLGNLVSNSAIVVISLGTSAPAALASLVFLVVVHKLEYFLNARIVGHHIHAAAWEMLLAMLCFEAVFGLPGVIIAPVVYAYAKGELADRALI